MVSGIRPARTLRGVPPTVPWTVVSILAIARGFRPQGAKPDLLRAMVVPLVLYVVLLGLFGSGAGLCYGPRYWVPFLPWFALATVIGLRGARRPAIIACG